MSRPSRTLGFPAVAHVFASAGEDEVGTLSKVLVADFDDAAAVEDVGQIQRRGGGFGAKSGGHELNVAVGSEAGDAAVWVHAELEVGQGWGGLVEEEEVSGRGAQGRGLEERLPLRGVGARHGGGCVVFWEVETLDGGCGRFVAVEVGSVDVETGEGAGGTEFDDDPVLIRVVSARLPACGWMEAARFSAVPTHLHRY